MRRTRCLGAAILLAVITAGCSGGGDDAKPSSKLPSDTNAATTTAAPTSSSPTASSSTAEPTPPALISQQTPAGAKATAEFWVTLLNAVYRGDIQPMKKLSSDRCDFCNKITGDVADLLKSGGTTALVSDYKVIRTAERAFHGSEGEYDVWFMSGQNTYKENSRDKPKLGAPAQREGVRLTMRWLNGHWLVTQARYLGG